MQPPPPPGPPPPPLPPFTLPHAAPMPEVPPTASARQVSSFQPNEQSLAVSDGTLLFLFLQNRPAIVMPLAGMQGVQQTGSSLILSNRFASDVHLHIDSSRLTDMAGFVRWLTEQLT